jgi:tungstate transport system substrate-binding protein
MNKKISKLFSLGFILAFLLSACVAPAAPTQAPAATQPPAATEAPAMTEAPVATEAPTAAPEYPKPGVSGHLVMATTTSTQDSGLLDYLLPMFEQETGVKVDVIAVGTGQALQIGQDGNADVLLVHARSKEDEFMKNGHGTRREDVMYNDFVIVGPQSDPAGIKGIATAVDAFKTIAEKKATFISRGDESGTHTKEKSIWAKAGITPEGDWYISAGQGMGEVLTMANEQQAYTLSDRATYLARTKEGLDLVILVEGDKDLLNPYGVIAVDPKKNPNIQGDLATKFIDWIISVPVQEKIAEFGKADFGQSLFIPDSKPWHDAQVTPTVAPTEVPPTAPPAAGTPALKITGKVAKETAWTDEEIKAMPTMSAESTNKQGEKSTYTGVLLSDLLKLAEPAADATTIVFVADDGFTAEVPIADLMACPNCILSFRNQGGFSIVMPGFSSKLQVKGVIEIQVK